MSYRKEEQFFMKEMEWGVNSNRNTTFMNYEFDIDSLYSVITRVDYLLRVNPNTDINLNIASYGGDVYAMLGKATDVMRGVDYLKELQKNINKILGEVTKKDVDFWVKIQRNDTYLTPEQCLKYGIIDEIV